MKYLAAYALLALSGKNNISNTSLTQTPTISKLSSTAYKHASLTKNSTESLRHSRESHSISWLLREARKSELVDQLLLLQAKARKRRSRLPKNNNPRRRKSPRRKKSLRLSRLMRIWEICSADFIELFKLTLCWPYSMQSLLILALQFFYLRQYTLSIITLYKYLFGIVCCFYINNRVL